MSRPVSPFGSWPSASERDTSGDGARLDYLSKLATAAEQNNIDSQSAAATSPAAHPFPAFGRWPSLRPVHHKPAGQQRDSSEATRKLCLPVIWTWSCCRCAMADDETKTTRASGRATNNKLECKHEPDSTG